MHNKTLHKKADRRTIALPVFSFISGWSHKKKTTGWRFTWGPFTLELFKKTVRPGC